MERAITGGREGGSWYVLGSPPSLPTLSRPSVSPEAAAAAVLPVSL